ncbi:MAG: HU family DNA-binding protein [Gammaproteobacteria bacterium]|nr:HU family DNA-binding protein [Gammaproteobacteria bacterium]MDD9824411.1 HU family DNA-binding protein [Gammaproteobacteria bacterium]MDD9863368.1 HU family DNA-binding protein [Gammaproteobacteria bacterium]
MNKTQFIEAVADTSDLPKEAAGRAVDACIRVISKELKRGRSVTLTGFGTFEVRKRKARVGRNPKTGEKINIKASKTPAFRAGKGFKDHIN